jgi:hypothetical protein
MDDNNPLKVWVNALKVIGAIAVMVGLVGLALWWADQRPVSSPALEQAVEAARQSNPSSKVTPDSSWGIAKDSPIRRK